MKIMNKVIMTLAGLLLIAASVLKIQEMLALPIPSWHDKGIWESYEFTLAQIPMELCLGIWLVSGLFRKAAWLVGTLAFLGFMGVTLYKGITGAESCGCFGQVHVNPWITLSLIDTPFFVLLALNRPGREYKLLPPPWPNLFHALITAVPIFAVLMFTAPALVAFKPVQKKPEDMEKVKIVYVKVPCKRPHADDPNVVIPEKQTIQPVQSQQVTTPDKAVEPAKSEPVKEQTPVIDNKTPAEPEKKTTAELDKKAEPDTPVSVKPDKPETPVKPVPTPDADANQKTTPTVLASDPNQAKAVDPNQMTSKWLEQIDIGDKLKSGVVIVLMYHHDCPTCATMVPKYSQYYQKMKEQKDDSMTFAFVAIPPFNEKGPVPADTQCLKGKLKETKGEIWAITSPYVIALVEGQFVKQWKQGTAPEPDKIFDEVFPPQ